LLLAVGCAPELGDGPPGSELPFDAGDLSVEPDDLVGITDAHNQARASVSVAPLEWDADLAAIALSWAAACVDLTAPAGLIDHNDGRSDNYPGYVGENIYGAGGAATAADAVAAWMSEQADYDIASNSCSGPACGHYTQVVWADSTRLGCGHYVCEDLSFGHTIVCNYAPGGNVGGQRPYPYP
jgi:pathogenesis-related protein 1